jgi:uncharacterized membrane protein YidH (DUF202 family)
LFAGNGPGSAAFLRPRFRLGQEFHVPARTVPMSRNLLLVLIGVLAVCLIGAGYLYYQERQSGIDININEHGVTIEGN